MVMEKLNTFTDASATSWLSDLLLEEMEDCNLFQQCQGPNLLGGDDEELLSHDIASALQQPLSSESYSSYPVSNSETLMNSPTEETSLERPTKQLKTKHTTSTTLPHDLSPSSSSPSPPSPCTSQILSFDNSNSPSPANTTHFYGFDNCTLNPKPNEVVPLTPAQQLRNMNFTGQTRKGSLENQNLETVNPQGQGTKRTVAHAQDHIIAERKRREKLSQSLIALAALIPGLKKMDKASVLGDAIKYVKELQERLKLLEEQNKNGAVECVVVVNKPQLSSDDHSSTSSDDGSEAASGANNNNSTEAQPLPHVEARVSEKDVLLRIHCHKQKGLLLKILVEIQNLHLFVVNSSVLPFGDSVLDITIVARMDTGYNLTINDLVRNLRVAALRSMS